MKRNLTGLFALALLLASACLSAMAGDQFNLISAGADWRYWDKTNYPGDDWRTLGFNDSGWSNGPAMLGFGDANGILPTTMIASNGEWTAYFRRVFTVSNPAIYTNLLLSMQRDDGAVVWLNGNDVWRNNMPTNGPILPNTPALTTIGGTDETAWTTTNASPTNLVIGDNILAVEVHQINLSSSDLLFDFSLQGLNSNAAPVLIAPVNPVVNGAPASLQLTATVRDDGNPMPADPSNPNPNDPNKLRYGWSVVSVPAGSSGVVWSGNPTNGEAFTYQGSPNPPGTVFTCNPTATFDVPGVYTLTFSTSDGEKVSSQNVTVWVRAGDDYRALGYMYLSPLPAAEYTSPQTRFVLVRLQNISPSAITNFSSFARVSGALSGAHAGQTKIAADGRTVIFTMNTGFTPNELVTVSLSPGVPPAGGGPIAPYQYQFMISGHMPGVAPPPVTVPVPPVELSRTNLPLSLAKDTTAASVGVAGIMPNGVSVPSDFPWISITTSNNPDPDPIFIDNRGGGGSPYNVIFDNGGSPIWYMRYPDERRDMKVQHNGMLTMLARDGGNHYNVLDTHYRLFTNCWAVNGYGVDEHELQMLADGTYLLFGLRSETVDMSRYVVGGNTAASVTEQIIQEFTPAGELIFQWRAWDHLDVRDQAQFINILGSSFDFPHMNAIDIDTDGHILLSSRNTSEVTKINRDTGEIIWRLGGTQNQFNFVNDPLNGPRNQHAARMVTTNHYTMFDNGNLHSPSISRGVEYVLDTTNMTATIVWQYPNPATPSLYSFYMGNAQRLSNGNTLIDWAVGNLPKLTEVRPDGTKAFEMNWVAGWEAYRTWRCPWQGYALQPYLIVESYPDNITLIFNQFGDTNAGFYKIYGGTAPQSTNLLATSGVTLKRLTTLQNGSTYYFRVTAVNKQGVEGPYSNEASTTVNIIKPGQNMVQNGDFSQGTASWIWTNSGTASATWSIVNGTSYVHIVSAGTALSDIQLRQAGLKLVRGKKYALQFDAWSSVRRPIEVRLGQNQSPYTTYQVVTPSLTTTRQHFTYSFVMQNTTDLNARLMFNMGGSVSDIYLDNVSLFSVPPGDLNLDGRVDLLDLQLFTRDWLKQQGGLNSDLDGNGKVDFNDFGILGENWSGN